MEEATLDRACLGDRALGGREDVEARCEERLDGRGKGGFAARVIAGEVRASARLAQVVSSGLERTNARSAEPM